MPPTLAAEQPLDVEEAAPELPLDVETLELVELLAGLVVVDPPDVEPELEPPLLALEPELPVDVELVGAFSWG